jgi:hypothetical protein
MIMIITEATDKVSDTVVEWLKSFNKTFKRYNYEKTVETISIEISTELGSTINIENIYCTSVWHRRARLNFLPKETIKSPMFSDLIKDQKVVNFFIERYLREKKEYIGSYIQEIENNKLNDLYAAKSVGFLIPESLVTNNKSSLLNFYSKYPLIISKQLSAEYIKDNENQLYSNGTKLLLRQEIENLPEIFAISLFQEYIAKEIEIRVFFFRDCFFSMAIFSQNDNQTQIDYRHYNTENPNRNIPFKLPLEVEQKLKEFNKQTGHTTGSFDLILTPKGQYYFLEINPSSQFHWVSQNCNYYIEKEIAAIL